MCNKNRSPAGGKDGQPGGVKANADVVSWKMKG